MKKAAIIFIFCIFQLFLFAQDVIYKIDGIEIKSKVLEIDENFIKYKNFDQQEGPIRNISRAKVFMIKYQNGTIEKFTTIVSLTSDTSKSIFETDKNERLRNIDFQIEKAISIKKNGKKMAIPGAVSMFVGTVIYTLAFNQKSEVSKKDMQMAGNIIFAISTPLFITGSVFFGISQAELNMLNKRKAELSFQMVPFSNNKYGTFTPVLAPAIGFRISF